MVVEKRGAAPAEARRGLRWWATRGAAVIGTVYLGATVFGAVFGDDDRQGEVVRVIDGDTLVALVDGEETTIRLLNVDTPETKDPDQPVQCLGPEATEFLTERLPAGTEIELQYDEERLDRYDRTLAGVYESESLVNAEIAEAGLGVPVYFAPNDRFLREVEEASARAQESAAGLFATEIGCTLPGQLQAQSAAVDQVPATVEGDPADALAGVESVLEDVDDFVGGLDVDGLPELGNAVMAGPLVASYLEDLRDEAFDVQEDAQDARTALEELKTAYDEEQERLEEERRKEQERLEKEERERQERKEQQEREEREERERQEQQAPQAPSSPSGGSSSSGGSSNDSSGGGSSDDGSSSGSSGGSSNGSSGGGSSGGSSSEGPGPSGCHPYGPEIPYSDDGGYTGLRYGMPGGKTFRKCS
ncbi:MAG TPA: thermonuclease family protein [Brachybacterium sp.]|nr:thermonuclease family protein [Brachybacterium sp.]